MSKPFEPILATRHDGVRGVGFWIHYAGLRMLSIAWEDRPAERFTEDGFERHRIRVEAFVPAVTDQSAKTNPHLPPEFVEQLTELYKPESPPADEPQDTETTGVPDQITGPAAETTGAPEGADEPEEETPAIVLPEPEPEAEEEPSEEEAKGGGIIALKDATSEADAVRIYLELYPNATNKKVVAELKNQGIDVSSSQVSRERKKLEEAAE